MGDDPVSTEKIIEIPLSELHPFKNHPFKVKDDEAMMETADLDKVTFTTDTLRKYFPKSYTPKRMEETIIKLLEQWQRNTAYT